MLSRELSRMIMQSPNSDTYEPDLCLHCTVSPANNTGMKPGALRSQEGSEVAASEDAAGRTGSGQQWGVSSLGKVFF